MYYYFYNMTKSQINTETFKQFYGTSWSYDFCNFRLSFKLMILDEMIRMNDWDKTDTIIVIPKQHTFGRQNYKDIVYNKYIYSNQKLEVHSDICAISYLLAKDIVYKTEKFIEEFEKEHKEEYENFDWKTGELECVISGKKRNNNLLI